MQKKKKHKKSYSRLKWIFLLIIFLLGGVYLRYRFFTDDTQTISFTTPVVSKNEHYSGVGQSYVPDGNGYSTTFTTANGKTYKEYKQNGDSPWAERYYWGGTMAENGCGITCLATLASGYGMKDTPEDLRKKYTSNETSHLAGERMSGELEKYFHLVNSDFLYADTYFQKDYIFDWLKEDKPILICVWDKPNSKWTTSSHYMLLLATDNISKVYVSNPNGELGGTKMSRLV